MITLSQYSGIHRGHPDWTAAREQNALKLLGACCALEVEMARMGVRFPDNPKTKNGVSGDTFGGFRPQSCPVGAPNSRHKQGQAVDRYDPQGEIDAWCLAHLDRLEAHGIWIEHPDDTPTWSHWQCVGVPSGNRVFRP